MIVQASIKEIIRVQDYRSYLNGSPHIGPLMRKRSNVITSCRWDYMKYSSERQKTVLRFLKSPTYQLFVQQFVQRDRQWLCAKLLPELETTLVIAAYKCHQVSTSCFHSTVVDGLLDHNSDVTMSAKASQITSISTVCSAVCSGAHKRNTKVPRHWPLCGESTGDRWPVDSPHNGPVTRKLFLFDDIIMWSIKHSQVCYTHLPVIIEKNAINPLGWDILCLTYSF